MAKFKPKIVSAPRHNGDDLYGGPVVKLIRTSAKPFAPYQPILVDRFGRMLIEATDFLRMKRRKSKRDSAESVHLYARMLADIMFVLANANGGQGIPFDQLDDDLLDRLRILFTGPQFHDGKPTGKRGVTGAVWNRNLSVLLQFLLYCESKGWTTGLIGVPTKTRSYRINLDQEHPYPVHEVEMHEEKPDEVAIPVDDAINAVWIAMEENVTSGLIRKRNAQIASVMDEALRRKEAINFPISAIPSAAALKALRAKAQSTGRLEAVPIRIKGAKTNHERMVMFPLRKVEMLRDFIDEERPKFKPRPGETAIFISLQNGGKLNPQSITNLYSRARAKARESAVARNATELELADIGRVHGHILRHRRVTDGLAGRLEAGLDPIHAMQEVMNSAGMSLSTMLGYLHLGQSRRKSVLIKQGRVNEIRDDEVLKHYAALDKARLDALLDGRGSGSGSRKKRR